MSKGRLFNASIHQHKSRFYKTFVCVSTTKIDGSNKTDFSEKQNCLNYILRSLNSYFGWKCLMQCLLQAPVRNTRRQESFCPEQGSVDFYVVVLLCNWLSSDLLNADVDRRKEKL